MDLDAIVAWVSEHQRTHEWPPVVADVVAAFGLDLEGKKALMRTRDERLQFRQKTGAPRWEMWIYCPAAIPRGWTWTGVRATRTQHLKEAPCQS